MACGVGLIHQVNTLPFSAVIATSLLSGSSLELSPAEPNNYSRHIRIGGRDSIPHVSNCCAVNSCQIFLRATRFVACETLESMVGEQGLMESSSADY